MPPAVSFHAVPYQSNTLKPTFSPITSQTVFPSVTITCCTSHIVSIHHQCSTPLCIVSIHHQRTTPLCIVSIHHQCSTPFAERAGVYLPLTTFYCPTRVRCAVFTTLRDSDTHLCGFLLQVGCVCTSLGSAHDHTWQVRYCMHQMGGIRTIWTNQRQRSI